MGRVQQEQLAHQVAQRSMMPSTTDQISYLRAQLAHRGAQLKQVRAERDNHFIQEKEEEEKKRKRRRNSSPRASTQQWN